MSVFRVKKENNYVMLDKHFLDNEKISLKAKGLLALLLSYPNDWQFYEKEIIKHTSDEKTSLSSGLKELMQNGYVVRQRYRNEKGQFKGYVYDVYETPKSENPKSENPKSENPTSGKRPLLNNNITNNNLTKNNLIKDGNGFANVKTVCFSDEKIEIYDITEKIIDLYFDIYEEYKLNRHPALTAENKLKVQTKLSNFIDNYIFKDDFDSDLELWKDMIIAFFNNVKSDGNINLFSEKEILKNRYYEIGGGSLDY